MKLIIQIGLKRSGNHGLINLFKKCYKSDNIIHLNDIHSFSYDLYKEYSNKKIEKTMENNTWSGFKGADLVIISLENKEIHKSLLKELKRFEHIPDVHFVFLLRNPYNNAASAYKYLNYTNGSSSIILIKYLVTLWKQYCAFFLEQREKCTLIIYDKFYQDKTYRQNIFNTLGINYNETFLNEIDGWGRSFFNQESTNTTHMDLFKRYLYFKDDPDFIKRVLMDKGLLVLWGEICRKFDIPLDKELLKILNRGFARLRFYN